MCTFVFHDPHLTIHLALSVFTVGVCIFFTCQYLSVLVCLYDYFFFSICPKTSLRSFSSWSVMSFPIPLENLFIFTFSVHLSLLFFPFPCSLVSLSSWFRGMTEIQPSFSLRSLPQGRISQRPLPTQPLCKTTSLLPHGFHHFFLLLLFCVSFCPSFFPLLPISSSLLLHTAPPVYFRKEK